MGYEYLELIIDTYRYRKLNMHRMFCELGEVG